MQSKFSTRLRSLRLEAALSQSELSKMIGVSKSSINMYERGEREPGFETLEIIADYFNVDMDYLLGKSDTKNMYQLLKQMGNTLAVSGFDPQTNELLSYADQLNAKGKERLCRYAEDLTRIPDYLKRKSPMPAEASTGEIRVAARGGVVVKPDHPVDEDAFLRAIAESKPPEKV